MDPADHRRSLSAWSPSPPQLAFGATLVLLGAFTRIRLLEPYGASARSLDEMRALVPVMLAAVALAHAALAALAARRRTPAGAVTVVVLAAAALPAVAELARPLLEGLLSTVAPHFCADAPEYCPPAAWSPLAGLLVGAFLAPLVDAAARLRDERGNDAPARMLWLTGLWTAAVTVAFRAGRLADAGPLALAAGVALACMAAGAADTARRALALRALLRDGHGTVTPVRDDDPEGLRPYAHVPGDGCDAVLRVNEQRERGPYRGLRTGYPLARVPRDVEVLRAALAARLRRQAAALAVATAALLAASLIGSAWPSSVLT